MTPQPDRDRRWKIGEVAASSGLTARTLHHWEALGLVAASARGPGGHREYTADDLGRLYAVLTLRDLGLPLATVRACLASEAGPRDVLALHLQHLDGLLESLNALRARVARLQERAEADSESWLDVLRLAHEADTSGVEVLRRHLDEEQIEAVGERWASVGPDRDYVLRVEWPRLYAEAESLRRAGATPEDPRVQRVVDRMDELSDRFTGGRPEVAQPVRDGWAEEPAAFSSHPEAAQWADVAHFVEAARAATMAPRHTASPSDR